MATPGSRSFEVKVQDPAHWLSIENNADPKPWVEEYGIIQFINILKAK
jgi:hypothetical protein